MALSQEEQTLLTSYRALQPKEREVCRALAILAYASQPTQLLDVFLKGMPLSKTTGILNKNDVDRIVQTLILIGLVNKIFEIPQTIVHEVLKDIAQDPQREKYIETLQKDIEKQVHSYRGFMWIHVREVSLELLHCYFSAGNETYYSTLAQSALPSNKALDYVTRLSETDGEWRKTLPRAIQAELFRITFANQLWNPKNVLSKYPLLGEHYLDLASQPEYPEFACIRTEHGVFTADLRLVSGPLPPQEEISSHWTSMINASIHFLQGNFDQAVHLFEQVLSKRKDEDDGRQLLFTQTPGIYYILSLFASGNSSLKKNLTLALQVLTNAGPYDLHRIFQSFLAVSELLSTGLPSCNLISRKIVARLCPEPQCSGHSEFLAVVLSPQSGCGRTYQNTSLWLAFPFPAKAHELCSAQ